jgi:hypothetical protein
MNLPPDIRHVFAAFAGGGVKCLLMGGQAWVHYGAAEFSKDIDFAILCDDEILAGLRERSKRSRPRGSRFRRSSEDIWRMARRCTSDARKARPRE